MNFFLKMFKFRKSSHNRFLVYAKKNTFYHKDSRQIFQVYPPCNQVTLNDIEDVISVSYNMSEKNKREYYYSNGIDYDRVIKYYNFVKKTEDAYKK